MEYFVFPKYYVVNPDNMFFNSEGSVQRRVILTHADPIYLLSTEDLKVIQISFDELVLLKGQVAGMNVSVGYASLDCRLGMMQFMLKEDYCGGLMNGMMTCKRQMNVTTTLTLLDYYTTILMEDDTCIIHSGGKIFRLFNYSHKRYVVGGIDYMFMTPDYLVVRYRLVHSDKSIESAVVPTLMKFTLVFDKQLRFKDCSIISGHWCLYNKNFTESGLAARSHLLPY